MTKYFVSYFYKDERKSYGLGNSFLTSNMPISEELIREFENKLAEDEGLSKVIVWNIQEVWDDEEVDENESET